MEAVWFDDYDLHTDKLFKRPGCPECHEPIGMDEGGRYRCFSCNGEVEVKDDEMLNWFAARSEQKITMEDDPVITSKDGKHSSGCGGKKCVETHWVRNKVTLEWQVAYGQCKKCGMQFIV